jgi:predicted thioesterase
MAPDLEIGMRGDARLVVADDDTAIAHRSGSVPVLATPCIVALCEEAAINAVGDLLPPGRTTVGMRVQVDHLQPTAVGKEVVAEAVLKHVEGRRLTFSVSVHDDKGLIAAGKVTRVIVDVEHFLQKSV